ncbi:acetyltransferase [Metabacillus arenae]|uniref:Acetyltransferase n=1 Tax=Metabacillus arenae TaxID=2771434 RepID=A0A926NJ86_9BACI|nr:acetyltransferase [Metabacillus arenae]MBD1378861.1 acetyltransferase [Metabacillus arenae]
MKIAIIGNGGHSKVIQDIIDSIEGNQIIGYFDDMYKKLELKNNIYFGPVLSIKEIMNESYEFKIVISIGENKVRKSIAQKLSISNEYYATFIHKSAIVSSSAKIGYGTVVMPNVVINADTKIGNHAIINTSAVVEHDNSIGDFVHVSPNATLTGSVSIEDGAHIGAGATIIPDINIGKWAKIGAGATVIHNIPSYCTAAGVPAKVKNKQSKRMEV